MNTAFGSYLMRRHNPGMATRGEVWWKCIMLLLISLFFAMLAVVLTGCATTDQPTIDDWPTPPPAPVIVDAGQPTGGSLEGSGEIPAPAPAPAPAPEPVGAESVHPALRIFYIGGVVLDQIDYNIAALETQLAATTDPAVRKDIGDALDYARKWREAIAGPLFAGKQVLEEAQADDGEIDTEELVVGGAQTIGGVLPPPWNVIIPGGVVALAALWRELRNKKVINRLQPMADALRRNINAFDQAKRTNPQLAQEFDNSADTIRLAMGPEARDIVDELRSDSARVERWKG